MKRALTGKRFFHAAGQAWAGQGQNLRTSDRRTAGMPLWARNAFVEGVMGVELRRRPAFTEAGP
jgi:hypothetical protein